MQTVSPAVCFYYPLCVSTIPLRRHAPLSPLRVRGTFAVRQVGSDIHKSEAFIPQNRKIIPKMTNIFKG